MHQFSELVYISTRFSLEAMSKAKSKVIDELQTNGSTISVKTLQMFQIQKAIIAIGMFSLFESIIQYDLNCSNGFEEAKKIISQSRNTNLSLRFEDFICAINVLKHGKGRSYDSLVAKANNLPFKIKLQSEDSFDEGDVAEVSTLIEVDDEFVLACAKIIEEISIEIRKVKPEYL